MRGERERERDEDTNSGGVLRDAELGTGTRREPLAEGGAARGWMAPRPVRSGTGGRDALP